MAEKPNGKLIALAISRTPKKPGVTITTQTLPRARPRRGTPAPRPTSAGIIHPLNIRKTPTDKVGLQEQSLRATVRFL